MTFLEFLEAIGEGLLAEEILTHDPNTSFLEPLHRKAFTLLGEYFAVGGMPEAVACWAKKKNPLECFDIHNILVDNYRQDFQKYATKFQIPYLDQLFTQIPRQLGQRFKYSALEGDFRKRELAPCMELLYLAGVIHPVTQTAAHGIPLGAEANSQKFKVIFVDIALAQHLLGLNRDSWFLHKFDDFVNKGEIVEAFIGQELLAHAPPSMREELYYWHKEDRSSQAEVDYVYPQGSAAIPIEVKGGSGRTLKSMHTFLQTHPRSPHGVRLSTHNYSVHEKIYSYPLYAAASLYRKHSSC